MSLLAAIIGAIVRALLGRWLPQPKDQTHAALDATKAEAKAFAAPARSKHDTLERLREHEQQ